MSALSEERRTEQTVTTRRPHRAGNHPLLHWGGQWPPHHVSRQEPATGAIGCSPACVWGPIPCGASPKGSGPGWHQQAPGWGGGGWWGAAWLQGAQAGGRTMGAVQAAGEWKGHCQLLTARVRRLLHFNKEMRWWVLGWSPQLSWPVWTSRSSDPFLSGPSSWEGISLDWMTKQMFQMVY